MKDKDEYNCGRLRLRLGLRLGLCVRRRLRVRGPRVYVTNVRRSNLSRRNYTLSCEGKMAV